MYALASVTLAAALCLSLAPVGTLVAQAEPGRAREQTADQQLHHALNRLAFGPRPGDVERVRTLGVDAWIAQQLAPETLNDDAIDHWLTRFPTLTMSGAEFTAAYPSPGQLQRRLLARQRAAGTNTPGGAPTLSPADSVQLQKQRRATARASGELLSARVARAVASERQLQEVLVDFWANHFNVFIGKPQTRHFVAEFERRAIRPHVFGSFRELLGAVAHSPAMLTYLDQAQSVADSGRRTLVPSRAARRAVAARRRNVATPAITTPNRPRGINENYARELMELHTLGVDGGYTQQDVTEVARALTGWTIQRSGATAGQFEFRAMSHDAEAKTILGEIFPAGGGQDEGERVLDLLAQHPSTARFIARKLVQRLVSDAPPADLVDLAAQTFLDTQGDLREVTRAIVTSDAFFSSSAYRAKVKTPFELVVSAARALGGEPDPTAATSQLIARMGQPIYGRATPDGYPDTADDWINTGSILNRMNFGLAVGAGRLPGARLNRWSTARALASKPTEAQVDGLVKVLFGGDVSTETRAILESGMNPLLARAPAASDSLFQMNTDAVSNTDNSSRPRRGGQRNTLGALRELTGFPKLVGLAIGAPEFQRR